MPLINSFEIVYRLLERSRMFLSGVDTDLREGKEVEAFARFLGFTIMVILVISGIILSIGHLVSVTSNWFMKVIAATLIVLFLLVIGCVIYFLWKKFLKDQT